MRVVDFTAPANRNTVTARQAADIPQPPELPGAPPPGLPLVQLLERSTKALERQLQNLLKVQPPAEKLSEQLLAGSASPSVMGEFAEQLLGKRIRAQMWAQQVAQSGALMAHVQQGLPTEQGERLASVAQNVLQDLEQKQPLPAPISGQQNDRSPPDFFDKLLQLIGLIKNDYLAGYQHVIDAFTRFFADFNQAITAKLKDWIEGGKDGKEVKLNVGQLRAALQALVRKFSPPNSAGVLFPAPGMEGASRAQAEKWRLALGLPADSLKQNANGSFSVVMDLSPLRTMLSQLPAKGDSVTWDTARFQSWQTGFNAQEERLKNMLQSFTQKYSNANGYHDNFNKILSSHLSQYADMLRAMLNI